MAKEPETLTHWKKLVNPEYLGAYSLDPGKDMILTIKLIKTEMVTGPDNRKEECTVAHFVENVKPMILNNTNCKTISKLYKTPFIEQWAGRKIQVGAETVKAFGEVVEALRVRNRIPAAPTKLPTTCADCGSPIAAFDDKHDADYVARHTFNKYGKQLCAACAAKQVEAGKVENPL